MNLVPLVKMELQVKREPVDFLVREDVLVPLAQLVPVEVMEVWVLWALLVPLGLLALQASQVLLAPRVNLDLLVTLALLVPRVPVVKWVFQAFLALLDLLETPEPMGFLVLKVLLAFPVLLGLPASLDPGVFLALLALLVLLEPEDLLVSPAQLVRKERAATRASLVLLGSQVLLAPVVKKEREAPLEKSDPLAPQDLLG